MPCQHLRQLYELCQTHDMKISSADVVRIACKQCQEIEVCPDVLTDEYESRQPHLKPTSPSASAESSVDGTALPGDD